MSRNRGQQSLAIFIFLYLTSTSYGICILKQFVAFKIESAMKASDICRTPLATLQNMDIKETVASCNGGREKFTQFSKDLSQWITILET